MISDGEINFEEYFKTGKIEGFDNIIKPEYNVEPYFDYDKIRYLRGHKIPHFALRLFEEPYIPNLEKKRFCDEFLREYLENEEYHKNVKGQFIAFLNNKFYGIVENEADFWNIGGNRATRTLIKIGKVQNIRGNVCKRECKTNSFFKRMNDGKLKEFIQHEIYNVNYGISYMNKLDKYTYKFFLPTGGKKIIWDTGCEITLLPFPELWDFKLKYFLKSDNLITETINNMKCYDEPITMNCAGGLNINMTIIYFKQPIYISVSGLNPVEIHKLVVPTSFQEYEFLIGLDIINQYTSIISKFDGKIELMVQNQREEI